MHDDLFQTTPREEKKRMLTLALSLGIVSAALFLLTDRPVMPWVLAGIAAAAAAGCIAYPLIGRGVYLVFALLSFSIGRVISSVISDIVYVVGIVLFGGALRLFGMDRMKKNFKRAREAATNFEPATPTDTESFRRQS